MTQFGAPRCVFGWIDSTVGCRYIAFCSPARRYLFKIVYCYPRPDAAERNPDAVGFLAEIVYGPNRELGALSVPRSGFSSGIMLDREFSVLGEITPYTVVMDGLFSGKR